MPTSYGGWTAAVMGNRSAGVSINGTWMECISCSVGKRGTILERQGIRGSRSHNVDDTRQGPYAVGGTIVLEPSPAELLALMALAIGVGGNIADSLTPFTVIVDRVTTVHTYTECKISRCTIRGSAGGIIQVTLEIVGKTESASGSTGTVASTAPYIFSDLTLTLASLWREVQEFELTIDNHLATDRYMNSQTLTDIPESDRTVTLRTTHSFAAGNSDLYNQALAGAGGTLVLNDGTKTSTFTFGVLQVPTEAPDITGKTAEIMLTLNMTARKTGATAEIAFAQV